MVLKDEGSSITVSGTKEVTGPTETGSTISPNELVCDLLKSTNTFLDCEEYSNCNLGGARRVGRGGRRHCLDQPIYAPSSASRPLRSKQVRHHGA